MKKEKSMKWIAWILFIVLILVLSVLLYMTMAYQQKEKKEIKYYRCMEKELGVITKDIFSKNNVTHDNQDWNVYIPCGYNDVEKELKSIQMNGKKGNTFIFGVNGCDKIVSKNELWKQLRDCYGREKASQMMPETWILSDPEEMKDFRKKFNGEMYILKKNVQRKEGLLLTDNQKVIENAHQQEYRVVQRYMKSVFLVGKRKVNLRIYYLIVVQKGKISFYMSNVGKCIYTNKDYNSDNSDFESNITSYHLDINIYKTHPLTFEDLRRYIDKRTSSQGKVLFDRIHLLMQDVSRCIQKNIYQSLNLSGTSFQLFGVDVIFDHTMHPYLLEMNKGPDMQAKDEMDYRLKSKVQRDMFAKVGIVNTENETNEFELLLETQR
jgi:hypothetical protein